MAVTGGSLPKLPLMDASTCGYPSWERRSQASAFACSPAAYTISTATQLRVAHTRKPLAASRLARDFQSEVLDARAHCDFPELSRSTSGCSREALTGLSNVLCQELC